MAALTSTIIAGTGAALGAYQYFKGQEQANEASVAAQKIANQQRALAEKDMVSGVQVPQLGYQLAQQSGAQRNVSEIQALQGAGAAAVLGGVPQLNVQGQQQDLQLRAAIDQAKYERDWNVAQQEQAIEQRKIARQNEQLNNQLQGAQIAAATGQANMNAGLSGIMSSLGTAGDLYLKQKALYPKEQTPAEPQQQQQQQLQTQQPQSLNVPVSPVNKWMWQTGLNNPNIPQNPYMDNLNQTNPYFSLMYPNK